MPKGVEHLVANRAYTVRVCVESLMPKGVEHIDYIFTAAMNTAVLNL